MREVLQILNDEFRLSMALSGELMITVGVQVSNKTLFLPHRQAAGTWQKSTGTSYSFLNSNSPAEGSTEQSSSAKPKTPGGLMSGGKHAASGTSMSYRNEWDSVLVTVDLYGGGVFACGMEGWRHFSQNRHSFCFSVTNATEYSSTYFSLRCCLCLWLNKKQLTKRWQVSVTCCKQKYSWIMLAITAVKLVRTKGCLLKTIVVYLIGHRLGFYFKFKTNFKPIFWPIEQHGSDVGLECAHFSVESLSQLRNIQSLAQNDAKIYINAQ